MGRVRCQREKRRSEISRKEGKRNLFEERERADGFLSESLADWTLDQLSSRATKMEARDAAKQLFNWPSDGSTLPYLG